MTRWQRLLPGLLLQLLGAARLSLGKIEDDGYCPLITLVPFTNEWSVPGQHDLAPGQRLERYPKEVIGKMGFSYMAAAQLAIEQFNGRDHSVVPELADIEAEQCNVYFPDQVVVNSARKDSYSIRGIFESMPPPQPSAANRTASEATQRDLMVPRWCAVIGPMSSRASVQSSAVTSAYGLPQFVYGTDDFMATSQESPTSVGMFLPVRDKANAVYQYLVHRHWDVRRDYLAVLYAHFAATRDFAIRLQDLATSTSDLTVVAREIPRETVGSRTELMARNIDDIKASGIQTILLAISEIQWLRGISEMLDARGMLEPDSSYMYILIEDATSLESVSEIVGYQPVGSSLDKLLNGALVLSATDRFAAHKDDPFLALWSKQDSQFVERMNALVPKDPKTQKPIFQASPTFFQKELPSAFSTNVFDSVLAAGLGACRKMDNAHDPPTSNEVGRGEDGRSPLNNTSDHPASHDVGRGEDGKPPHPPHPTGGSERRVQQEAALSSSGTLQGGPQADATDSSQSQKGKADILLQGSPAQPGSPQGHEPPNQHSQPNKGGPAPRGPGSEFVDAITKTSFAGASGRVAFGESKGCAKCRAANGVVFGAYNIRPRTTSNGHRTYDAFLTAYADEDHSVWNAVPGQDFIYRNGGREASPTVRIVAEENFLSGWVRGLGLFLFVSALWIAVTSMVFVVYLRKYRTICAAQPFFLNMICVGSILMSVSIFTLSWDENAGWSQDQLSVACTLTPWFFFVGHLLMFSAMATKLYRVDQVLQMTRGRRVKILQVMGPLVFLLLAATLILTIWTALDPWRWERNEINTVPAETYGECTCDNFAAYFYSLTGLLVFCKIATAAMAWKTSDIPQDFSDTGSVFYAITTQIQAWWIGIPILVVLGNDSVEATYFGRVLLIWVFAVSGVSLVVVPRIFQAVQIRRNPNRGSRDRVRISGLNDPPKVAHPPRKSYHSSNTTSTDPTTGSCLDLSLRQSAGSAAPSTQSYVAPFNSLTASSSPQVLAQSTTNPNNGEALNDMLPEEPPSFSPAKPLAKDHGEFRQGSGSSALATQSGAAGSLKSLTASSSQALSHSLYQDDDDDANGRHSEEPFNAASSPPEDAFSKDAAATSPATLDIVDNPDGVGAVKAHAEDDETKEETMMTVISSTQHEEDSKTKNSTDRDHSPSPILDV